MGSRFEPPFICIGSDLWYAQRMTGSPLAQPELWNEIHAAYEKTLVPLFSIAAQRGLELVGPSRDAEILDVACGPGTLTLLAAPKVRKVCAVDFASSMIDLLEKRRTRAALTNIEAQVADGTKLPYENDRFDAAFSCFGVFLFADRAAGFTELRRVLKPGAKLMISSWVPGEGPIREMNRIIREVIPEMPFRDGQSPLGTPEEIVAEMGSAGFQDLIVESVPVNYAYPSAEVFWKDYSQAAAPIMALRRTVSVSQWPEIESRIVGELRSAFPTRLSFDRHALVAVGGKART